jgi:hypothetical protein
MTKRVVTTIFLLVFTVSVVGRSVERTKAWAAEHGHKSARSITEVHKQSPRESQTKLWEDGTALYVSFIRSFDALPSADIPRRSLTGFVSDPRGQSLSSRAPPAILFF